jgi:four helix bundle protein
MQDYKSFEDLETWKASREFRKEISKLSKTFPEHEKFELTKQIKRSSRSVTANLAEGQGRFHHKDNMRFTRISRGSLKETLDHLIVAFDEEYITQEQLNVLRAKYDHCLKLLNGYTRYIESQVKPTKRK